MRPDQALKYLSACLRSHDIPITEKDVRCAFEENSRDSATAWVQQYLSNETQLSLEEAELFSTLERSGTARRIAASFDLDTVSPFLDADIEAAVHSLEMSTSAITAQNRILKLRKEALIDFQAYTHQTQTQYHRIAGLRQRNRVREKQNTDLAVDELLQTVIQNATLAQSQLQAYFHAYPNRVAGSLRQDDTILRKLEEIAPTVQPLSPSLKDEKSRVEALCGRLVTYNAQEIRCRLDRKYLESLGANESHLQSIEAQNLVSSLKAELETLYPEIRAVAQISVGQSFETPLAESIENDVALEKARSISILDDIDATLLHLEEKAARFVTRLLVHDTHLAALDELLNEVETVHPGGHSNIPTFESSDGTSDLEIIASSKPAGATDHDLAPKQDNPEDSADMAHRQLLHLLGVAPLHSTSLPTLQGALDSVIYDRERKTKEGLRNLNIATDLALGTHLNNASRTNSLLLGGLLEDTAFQNIELFDPNLKLRASNLKKAIDEIRSDMAGLDMEEIHLASSKREIFVNKWNS